LQQLFASSIAIAATTTETRFYALLQNGTQGSLKAADFTGNQPAIGPDGVVYSGAVQALVADTFDGIAWDMPQVTPESPRYVGSPAFRSNELLLATTAGALNIFPIPFPVPNPTTVQVA